MGACTSYLRGELHHAVGRAQLHSKIASASRRAGSNNGPLHDTQFESGLMAVLYAKERDGSLKELGRTEVIMNCSDPAWIGKINVDYQFENVQQFIFRVYDVGTSYRNSPTEMSTLQDQAFLGEACCVLSEILTKQSQRLMLNLHSEEQAGLVNLGTFSVHAEETIASRNAVNIAFRCSDLNYLFPKNAFLRISRIVESGDSVRICELKVVNNNSRTTFEPLTLTMEQFGSKDNPLCLECFHVNSSGNLVLIGKIQRSIVDLVKLHKEKVGANFTLSSWFSTHEKVLKGQLFVDKFLERKLGTFVDYMSSGFELNFMVAVDFTVSNGNPRSPTSLHYIDPTGRLNDYQQAITEVGEVIQSYDSNRRFHAWGFGGRTRDGSVSHCFNLNGSVGSFEVEGVEGILTAYASAFRNVTLSGPTSYSQVINAAADIAGLSNANSKYFVLLIITSGILNDLQETKNALVRAYDLPLSVLIVGVGCADFTQMKILYADNGQRLKSPTGQIATRDIVQFVPMREVHGGQKSIHQALLKDLPGQFLTYMREIE